MESQLPRPELPLSVKVIRYDSDLHTDHRSSILAVELIGRPYSEAAMLADGPPSSDRALRSAHIIGEVLPSGTHLTGQTLDVTGEDGRPAQLIVGAHWTEGEILPYSTAGHDLAIALMCFDQVFIPTGSIGHIFRLLGEFRSDALAAEGVLQFIHWEGYDSIWLESAAAGFGHLATGRRGNGDPGEMISRQLSPVPGKEAEAAALLARIERSTVCVDLSGEKNFADVCSGLFVSPKTRMLLGISEGTPAGQIPRWAAHPALRVVQIAPIGATCQKLGFSSMKIMPGAAEAAELAFSALSRGTLASDPGSYALSGQFGVIHETALAANPGIWDAIIRFRTGGPGLNFRAEILKQLALNNGAEIVPAINGRLHDMLPPAILNLAR